MIIRASGSVPLILVFASLVLAEARPSIPEDQCRIADIGIGTRYEFVVDSLGPPAEENSYRISTASPDRPKKALIYDGLYIALIRGRAMLLKATTAGYALPNGISVGSSENEVVGAFGVSPTAIDGSRSYLAFSCLRPNEKSSGLLLQILLIHGEVDNIVLNKNW